MMLPFYLLRHPLLIRLQKIASQILGHTVAELLDGDVIDVDNSDDATDSGVANFTPMIRAMVHGSIVLMQVLGLHLMIKRHQEGLLH